MMQDYGVEEDATTLAIALHDKYARLWQVLRRHCRLLALSAVAAVMQYAIIVAMIDGIS